MVRIDLKFFLLLIFLVQFSFFPVPLISENLLICCEILKDYKNTSDTACLYHYLLYKCIIQQAFVSPNLDQQQAIHYFKLLSTSTTILSYSVHFRSTQELCHLGAGLDKGASQSKMPTDGRCRGSNPEYYCQESNSKFRPTFPSHLVFLVRLLSNTRLHTLSNRSLSLGDMQ